MKSTPAVFLTSLAVSAFSLTIPLPAATTVLNLFIGEDLSVQHIAQVEEETSQHHTHRVEGSLPKPACSNTEPDRKEEAIFKADALRASVSGDILRLLPDRFLEQLSRANVNIQRLQLKYTTYSRLCSWRFSGRNDRVYIQRDRLLLPKALSRTALSSAMIVEQRVKRIYRVAGVSSSSFLRSM